MFMDDFPVGFAFMREQLNNWISDLFERWIVFERISDLFERRTKKNQKLNMV